MANYWLAADIHYQLPIINYQLPITNYPSPITNYQLPITNLHFFQLGEKKGIDIMSIP